LRLANGLGELHDRLALRLLRRLPGLALPQALLRLTHCLAGFADAPGERRERLQTLGGFARHAARIRLALRQLAQALLLLGCQLLTLGTAALQLLGLFTDRLLHTPEELEVGETLAQLLLVLSAATATAAATGLLLLSLRVIPFIQGAGHLVEDARGP